MYVFESKSVLPWDINPVRTQYFISKFENPVRLIENIDKLDMWRCAKFSTDEWLHIMLYICVIFLVCTIVPVGCWEISLKYHCLFLSIMWYSIRSIYQNYATFCWYPPLNSYLISPDFLLCVPQIFDSTLITEPTSQIYLTFFINLLFFLSGFTLISPIHFPPLSLNNVDHIKDIYCITKLIFHYSHIT